MAAKSSEPSRRQVKSAITSLINNQSALLPTNRNSLVYRIRREYGWPSSTSYLIQRVILNKAVAEIIELLDKNNLPLVQSLSVASVKAAAGCRVLPASALFEPSSIPVQKKKSAPPLKIPLPLPGITAKDIPQSQPDPTADDILDMIVLHLWLEWDCEFKHPTNAELAIASKLYLRFPDAAKLIEEAVDEGYEQGRLGVFPRNAMAYTRIMVSEKPTEASVEDLRKRFPYVSNGRPWPPRKPTTWRP